MIRIYVASSWRSTRHRVVVDALRDEGYDVYDFRNPAPGDHGFGWRQVEEAAQPWSAERMREVLKRPRVRQGFETDMKALRRADVVLLVLPCGRSAHLELGWAAGSGRSTLVLLDDPISEPELMYLMNTALCVNLDEVRAWLRGYVAAVEVKPAKSNDQGDGDGDCS